MTKATARDNRDAQPCPNCQEMLTIPKSTRSFICRSCNAILNVIDKDETIVLKVVGKSVEEDTDYIDLEREITGLKSELDRLHGQYQSQMAQSIGSTPKRIGIIGLVVAVAALFVYLFSPQAALIVGAVGLVAFLFGISSSYLQKRSHTTETANLVRTISQLGSKRDLLQRKAAQLKTRV